MGRIEDLAAWTTSDQDYQMLLGHTLNHFILVPLLVTLYWFVEWITSGLTNPATKDSFVNAVKIFSINFAELLLLFMVVYVLVAMVIQTVVTVGIRVWRICRS